MAKEDWTPELDVPIQAVPSSKTPKLQLKLIPGSQIIAELKQARRFQPAGGFYTGHMGKVYDAAIAVFPGLSTT